jgi:hypothetical protein
MPSTYSWLNCSINATLVDVVSPRRECRTPKVSKQENEQLRAVGQQTILSGTGKIGAEMLYWENCTLSCGSTNNFANAWKNL